LIYNNTEYIGTKYGTGDTILFRRNVTAPGVATVTNISFYWEIGLTSASGTSYFNLTLHNQTVNIMNMSLYGHPYTVPYINFTAYDEQTLTEINATLDLTFTYVPTGGSVSNIFSYSDTSETNSTWSFAIDPPDETYTIDTTLEVDAAGYTHRFYNFEGLDFTNDTTEIGLYLLNESKSTSFIVSVRDSSYVPLSGIEVYLQRYYPSSNIWHTVEISETNGDGRTIEHIFTEDAKYRFKLYRDGILLYTTHESIIYCESTPCSIEIIIPETFESVLGDSMDLDNLESSMEYDESTDEITFTYSDTSGNFTQGRIYVIRMHPGNTTIEYVCNSTSTSSTAILTCDLTGEVNGTYIASGYIIRDEEYLVEREAFNKIRSIVQTIGLEGILWSFFFLIGIVMLGVYRPSLAIFFAIIGSIALWALQLMEIPITALISIIGIGIILLIGVRRQ